MRDAAVGRERAEREILGFGVGPGRGCDGWVEAGEECRVWRSVSLEEERGTRLGGEVGDVDVYCKINREVSDRGKYGRGF